MHKNNNTKVKTLILIIISLLLCFFQSIVNSPTSIFTGICILLPFIIAIGVNETETTTMWFGLAIGIVIDCLSSGIIAFNAIMLMLIGYFSSTLIKCFFNKSLRSCIVLSVISSLLYYCLFFIVFRLNGNSSAMLYLTDTALKGLIYTIIACIPLYYIVLLIEKRFSKEGNKWQKKKKILE